MSPLPINSQCHMPPPVSSRCLISTRISSECLMSRSTIIAHAGQCRLVSSATGSNSLRNDDEASNTSSAQTDEKAPEEHASSELVRHKRAQDALIAWVKVHPDLELEEVVDTCMEMINQNDMRFGAAPFDNTKNATRFFAALFGSNNALVEGLGMDALAQGEHYKRQGALIEWVETEPRLRGVRNRCIRRIQAFGYAWGAFPFNTESDAQVFFEVIFGETSNTTASLGTASYIRKPLDNRIVRMATKVNPMGLAPRFVNRVQPLQVMAKYITEFNRYAKEPLRQDSRRKLPLLFSAGMDGWGKTELGCPAVLQFNQRGKDLELLSLPDIDVDVVKSTWLCYVDMKQVPVQGERLFAASFVSALANTRKAVKNNGEWEYSLVLTDEERKNFEVCIKNILKNEGLGYLDGEAILTCFRTAMNSDKLNGGSQHILLHVDEAAEISAFGENDAEKKRLIYTFWNAIPLRDDPQFIVQPFFTSSELDLSPVGSGSGNSPTGYRSVEFDMLDRGQEESEENESEEDPI